MSYLTNMQLNRLISVINTEYCFRGNKENEGAGTYLCKTCGERMSPDRAETHNFLAHPEASLQVGAF